MQLAPGLALSIALVACAKPSTLPAPVETKSAKTAPQEREDIIDPVAVLLLIDRSGSMSGKKIEAARAAAKASLRTLTPESLFGLITFDQTIMTVVPMQHASERQAIEVSIDEFTAAGGTDVRPALREARRVLARVKAQSRHIILLSDGRSPYEGVEELAEDIKNDGVTISCVGIGDFDPSLLELIADNGRVRVAELPSELPRLFAMETRSLLGKPDVPQ